MFSAVCKSKMIICAKGRAVSHFARTSYTVQSCSIRTRAGKESPTSWAQPSPLLKSAKKEIKWFQRLKSPIASNPASRNCDKHFTFDMQRILRTTSTVFMGRFAPASSLVQSSPTPSSLERISYLAQGVREGKELSGYRQRCRQMTLFSTKLKAIFNLNAGPESAGVLLSFRCYSTGDDKPTAAQGKGTEASSTPGRGEGVTTFKELYENPWTIPNFLCMARIALSPVLGYLIVEKEFNLSLGLFVLAGVTDLLDGYIARNWANQKSALGSALDPLADKILISVLYISLTYAHLIPVPLTAMIISRDVALIAAVFYVRYKTVPPPRTLSKFFNPCYATAQLKPTFISKVNTAVQLILVAASLAAPVFQYVDSVFLQTLWYITAMTTAASAYSYYHYGKKTVQVLNHTK
ncbi:cardiolipin synthase (CMP-forming) isoform X1 [Acipenser oxyrinchus oxyrinchus]|uniref:Cardiolipin synthase (CMP-forming) n=1 Tax=Acipenser oxyrinchus oxyrinchus TaxID=40147 RepID=A0AAD8GAE5_ACIOX|nr:cardiolipin synthase (CMP-forming) isoform X1 [Acipenser oxyrinchus oxyrinchus]